MYFKTPGNVDLYDFAEVTFPGSDFKHLVVSAIDYEPKEVFVCIDSQDSRFQDDLVSSKTIGFGNMDVDTNKFTFKLAYQNSYWWQCLTIKTSNKNVYFVYKSIHLSTQASAIEFMSFI